MTEVYQGWQSLPMWMVRKNFLSDVDSGEVRRRGDERVRRSYNSPQEFGMQYMLLIYGNEQTWATLPPEKMQASFTAYMEYSRKLVEAGAMRGGEQLQPSGSASTVR